ncbi:hypothetical protein [Spirosoma sp.]|uniref:hypothetical protein n=1 Tax=Spirosoma sp. TaxID=1899569 RepID=UPI002623FC7D|nr:hypothetical protein [Spirosoma sp.]MCX6216563.1 hypothetical protein [Spirosoma sp.]
MAVQLNETATLKLRADSKDFANDLAQLDTKAKELRTTLKDIEKNGGKGSEEWKKYKAELKDVQTETKNLKKEVDITTLTYGQLQSRIKDLNRELKGTREGTEAFVKASKQLGEAERQFKKVKDEADSIRKTGEGLGQPSLWQKIGGGVGLVAKAMQAFVALQIVGYVIDIGKAIFETTAKFEKYGKVLETALGSEKEAKNSMSALKDLAKNTVFTVDQLTDGYVKMVNRGLRPSKAEMISLTDLAASQGKEFDQLVEAALDASTGEFERLKEFGIKASKSGDTVSLSFKGMNQTVKNTPEAINGALIAFGKMPGVLGQNSTMMQTLGGQASNLEDNFDALKVELGEKFRPVFTLILQGLNAGIPIVKALVNVIVTLVTAVVGYQKTLMDFYISSAGVMKNMGVAIKEFLSGNFEASAKAWEQTKAGATAAINQVKTNAKSAASAVAGIWTDKAATEKAEFAGKDQGAKYQKGLTDEQKKALEKREKEAEKARKKEAKAEEKALEDVKKANEKALEDIAKLEAETHIASIKDEMQREFVKLMAKRDQEAEEIRKSVASEEIKNKQLAALDKKLKADITKTAAEFAEKRKKAEEEADKKRLEAEKAIIEAEKQAEAALLDWRELMAKGNAKKLEAIHRDRENSIYRLTKERLDAEESAEKAKAAREITDKEQLRRALEAIENRYDNERQLAAKKHTDAIAKINEELQEKKKSQWGAASNAFSALLKFDLNGFIENADKMFEGEKSAWQKRLAQNMAKYEAVGQMAQAAVGFLLKLEQQKTDRAIAEAQRERDAKVKLLNEQIQLEKAAQDAAEFEKQRVTQESNTKIQTIKDASERTISDLESQYRQLSSSEEKRKLEEQLSGYKENADEKASAAKQQAEESIEAAQSEAKATIEAAKQAEKEAIKSATNAKLERIDAAEATRDAEIAAINQRKDIDQATRKQLLAEARDKFDQEKKLAEDEAKVKIEQAKDTAKAQSELAKDTARLKTELANDQAEAELKAIEAVKNGDQKAAKAILDKAKEDQKEKIRLAKEQADKAIEEAEKEKREKLKKVEAEKQTRIQNQKELNRQIEAENEKARLMEAAAKRKQWEAQKKADIASALITGALATLKALASSFWPANLVFAAMSAVMTGVQVAMIKRQEAPQFRHGGFIASGGRHGSRPGSGGIALVDRATGQETGEMEGDEAIISREQTAANLPLIQRMFSNARTPGRRSKPVTDFRGPALRNGGILDSGYWSKDMFLYGGVKRSKPASGKRGFYEDGGMYEGATDPSLSSVSADSEVAIAQAQGREQLRLLADLLNAITLSDTHSAERAKALSETLSDHAKQRESLVSLLIQSNKNGLMMLNDDLGKAIAKASADIISGLKSSSSTNDRGLEALSAQQRLSFALLASNLSKGFSDLTSDTKKGFEEMSSDVVKAIETLSEETKKSLEELSQDVVTVTEREGKQTDQALGNLASETKKGLDSMAYQVSSLRGSINAVEGAVYQVRDAANSTTGAVYGTNNAGKLDALISSISSFSGK